MELFGICFELCFNLSIFVLLFKNTLYRQVFGAPIRSYISPVVANIYIYNIYKNVEKTAINSFHTPPILWVRFVDDPFYVNKRSCVGEFHDHLNGISFFIKFTYELVMDFRLPFLNVLVTRQHKPLSLIMM